MRVENSRDLAGKVSIAGRLCPVTRHDGAGGDKPPQPSLGSGDRAGEGLCSGLGAVAWNQQRPPCPRCRLSPPWGQSAPCCGDSAGQGTQRAGTSSGDKRDNPRPTPLPRPCYGQKKEAGKGRAAQHPPFPPSNSHRHLR